MDFYLSSYLPLIEAVNIKNKNIIAIRLLWNLFEPIKLFKALSYFIEINFIITSGVKHYFMERNAQFSRKNIPFLIHIQTKYYKNKLSSNNHLSNDV